MKPSLYIFVLIAISLLMSSFGFSQNIHIDHVIAVFTDLDSAVEHYSKQGFNIKKGRLHPNGLKNAHIKFRNSTSLELISIAGTPTDNMAREYEALLKNGESGVFLSISGIGTDSMQTVLSNLNIDYDVARGKNWNYITFNKTPGLEHLFFIENFITVIDSPFVFQHENRSEMVSSVYIDGNEKTLFLLRALGLASSGKIFDRVLGDGVRWSTKTGDIVVLMRENLTFRPRIRAISFAGKDRVEILRLNF